MKSSVTLLWQPFVMLLVTALKRPRNWLLASLKLSVRMGQTDSRSTDCREISYLVFFLKLFNIFRVLLKAEENKSHYARRPTYGYDIWPRQIFIDSEKLCSLWGTRWYWRNNCYWRKLCSNCDVRAVFKETADHKQSSIIDCERRVSTFKKCRS